MQEINWNLFRTKFNGKEARAFEYLCYLLFCREFGVGDKGIFRFKNQPGIETEPIEVNGKWVGFQSKFFDKTISRPDIEDSIATTNKQYPNVTKIYVYVSLEFSKSKAGKGPKSKTQIEEFAKSKGIDIKWRVPSHIEAQLALAENMNLAEYFFSLETGVLEAIVHITGSHHYWRRRRRKDGPYQRLSKSSRLSNTALHLQGHRIQRRSYK